MSQNVTSNITRPMGPPCAKEAPPSWVLLAHFSTTSTILAVFLGLIMALTVAIYIEEIVFIIKTFRIALRRKKTIWVLAFYPMFSVCCYIGILVPRAGPFVHMVANLYFCTCLYQLMRLIIHYMGGAKKMFTIIEKGRRFQMNTMPVCCCCVCLPRPIFHRLNMFKLTMLVLQIIIVRPIVLFIAAFLYMDKTYITGQLTLGAPFFWIMLIHLVSTCTAVYGLVMLSKALGPELDKDFSVRGKILSIQGTLIMTVIPNLIISGLVASGKIKCNPLLPSKVVGEEIYYGTLVLIMLPFSLVGRHFFHRASDGMHYATGNLPESKENAPAAPSNGVTPDEKKCLHDTQPISGDSNSNDIKYSLPMYDANTAKAAQGMNVDDGESIV